MDTIFALGSARGKAGVAVIRLSGPLARNVAERLAGTLPEPRRTYLRTLRWDGVVLDQALVVRFEAGASFSGDEVAELHVHGGQATVQAVLQVLGSRDGLRLAEPGEFTRRAFESGALSLSEVEGLADLIEAETEAQRKQALRILSGAVGQKVAAWRADLIRAGALIEATIDFADEDVPVDVTPEVLALLDSVLQDLRGEVVGSRIAERVRDGFEVAIVGAPNAGKSTLLNALAGREAAITSARAGTTRDVIEVRMDLGGLAVTLLDTAGLRATDDEVEKAGIARAVARAEAADLRVFLDDGDLPQDVAARPGDILARAKADVTKGEGLAVSGLTGLGISDLVRRIAEELEQRAAGAGTTTRERHRVAMLRAVGALESAQNAIWAGQGRAELIADDLRQGLRALESLVGKVDVEDYLDEIFSSFCIGK
ncbi:tRNA uridine-5-carboxymethylaminomethyl(34) synthesis GTPase MnmE [Neogemmobacter tilapiae]|uniref:tRNA modification GTPase MnmE n=1 Tax=Neogemmobacter tilapiae TaxID=875041 RepID=A0A918WKP5_9RHOB|nr:tRNA uridine-5-carboxymethylaminomethyl(34) synthesis GTPase MnmE [Gemmobacter tilapiae]GHC51700.1 tRNA modification GTPase MnmE [Gemmobacter tilapiae]